MDKPTANAPERTNRLTFRRLTEGDAENLYRLMGHPEVMRFSTGPVAREEIPGLLKKALIAYAEDRPSHYAVLDRLTGAWLGCCGEDTGHEALYEITYRFDPSCWNQGIATEAVKSLLDYGFTCLGLHTLAAVVDKGNTSSIRVLNKVGMGYHGDVLYHGVTVMQYLISALNNPSPLVDKAPQEDLEAVLVLQKLAYASEAEIIGDFTIAPLHQTLAEIQDEFKTRTFLVVRMQGDIIGSVRAYEAENTCYIGKLIVHPDYQNQGLGTRLLLEAERLFPHVRRYELFTGEKSEKNLYLYQKQGYQEFKRQVVSERLTLVFLEKEKELL